MELALSFLGVLCGVVVGLMAYDIAARHKAIIEVRESIELSKDACKKLSEVHTSVINEHTTLSQRIEFLENRLKNNKVDSILKRF